MGRVSSSDCLKWPILRMPWEMEPVSRLLLTWKVSSEILFHQIFDREHAGRLGLSGMQGASFHGFSDSWILAVYSPMVSIPAVLRCIDGDR